MIYEKKLNAFSELLMELGALDLDAGIRATARYNSKKSLVFITRSPGGYTALVYSVKPAGKEVLPDKRLAAKEFADTEQAREFLEQVVAKPLKAFAY